MRFGDEYSAVEEREVDAPMPQGPPGRSLWYVEHGIALDEYISYREPAFEQHDPDKVTLDGRSNYCVTLWALDEEDALRQAKERFSRFKEQQPPSV